MVFLRLALSAPFFVLALFAMFVSVLFDIAGRAVAGFGALE